MKSMRIVGLKSEDHHFPLLNGAGSDAVHTTREYAFAATRLSTGTAIDGFGIALTLGDGNRLVCDAIEHLGKSLIGWDLENLMHRFGEVTRRLADDPGLRWLGPHKGVIHLALASIVNACFDLWAKSCGVPLWQLLLDLEPEQIVRLLDLSYIEDAISETEVLEMLRYHKVTRSERVEILTSGYPGYDTSVGWFKYDDNHIRIKVQDGLAKGFRAFKLKVGSKDPTFDLRRATMLRSLTGPDCKIMFDANQQWTYQEAKSICQVLRELDPYWIEEPTHPDDVAAHCKLVNELAPLKIALGEHVPNRVAFKNFILSHATHFVQADCTRLAGISEFLTVSLLARKYGLPVVPHVGDMGQIHQHLVLFNHIALGHEVIFLEHIPHLHQYFATPARVKNGLYAKPQEPGISCDLRMGQ